MVVTLAIVTVLYVLVAAVITGTVPFAFALVAVGVLGVVVYFAYSRPRSTVGRRGEASA